MVLGAGTFVPRAKFAFPRSYLYGIWFSFDTGSVVNWTDNTADFIAPGGTVTGRVTFAPEFWAWSSNCYTLDFAIIESWYAVFPSPTQNPLPFALTYYSDPLNGRPYLVYNPFSAVGTADFKHAAPPAPSDYWRPPWL